MLNTYQLINKRKWTYVSNSLVVKNKTDFSKN